MRSNGSEMALTAILGLIGGEEGEMRDEEERERAEEGCEVTTTRCFHEHTLGTLRGY
jgi:hypothetical protein